MLNYPIVPLSRGHIKLLIKYTRTSKALDILICILTMNQPLPESPQEAWLQVVGKGLVTFPEGWWNELGMQDSTFVKAKKEGKRVIIDTQAVERAGYHDEQEKNTLLIANLKKENQQLEQLYRIRNPKEVWQFLETHQYLVPLLIEAHGHIYDSSQIFGK